MHKNRTAATYPTSPVGITLTGLGRASQLLQQLLVQAAEASVRHDENDVAAPARPAQRSDDIRHAGDVGGGLARAGPSLDQADGIECVRAVPFRVEQAGQDHLV